MSLNANKKFWKEFIELYKSLPELWKVKSEVYRNRLLKDAAYDKMVEKMEEIEPDASRDMVRSKVNVLRSSYRRELKRLNQNKLFGVEYTPSLWYFNDIDFLREETQLEIQPESSRRSIDEAKFQEPEENDEFIAVSLPQPSVERIRPARDEPKPKRSRTSISHFSQFTEPESEIISRTWGLEFSKLRADQQLYAKKAINDILFEGRLGNLHRNSVVVNHNCPGEAPSASYSEHLISRSNQSPGYSNQSLGQSGTASPNSQVMSVADIKIENWDSEEPL